MTPVLFGLFLLLLLAGLGAAFAWQESRAEVGGPVEFVVRDAIAYVWEHLDPGARDSVRRADVERMILWETQYQQEVFVGKHGDEMVPVVAGYDAAVYIQQHGIEAGYAYHGPIIEQVLALEVEYLMSIGAVAEVVEDGS